MLPRPRAALCSVGVETNAPANRQKVKMRIAGLDGALGRSVQPGGTVEGGDRTGVADAFEGQVERR